MFKLKKQPGETIVGVSIDFAARLISGETIGSPTVTATLLDGTESTGNDFTVSAVSVNTTKVLATIAGGYDGCTYKLTYRAVGSLGNIPESEIKVTVKEL